MTLVNISRELSDAVELLRFSPPITHVYNPLVYAREPHERYLEAWGAGPKRVLFLGMNPGPFGMAQTGVPFGDVKQVRGFMGISGRVSEPPNPHPKRPVQGFDCPRSEVSGTRLWGWAESRFKSAEAFFKHCFVVNYCPLVFMEPSGKNFTPDKLPKVERDALFSACDGALLKIAELLQPSWVVGVGAFAQKRAQEALSPLVNAGALRIGTILHPSPASPRANRGWASEADQDLIKQGIEL